jgi:hypothetical protein
MRRIIKTVIDSVTGLEGFCHVAKITIIHS